MLVLALLAGASALATLFMAFQQAQAIAGNEALRRYLAGLLVLCGGLLIFSIFCLGALAIRMASLPLPRSTDPEPTQYTDAWKIAGQRMPVPDEDDEQ